MTEAAYKLVILLKRREGLSPEAFSQGWLEHEERRPLQARGLLSHVFDSPLEGSAGIAGVSASPYDAAVETWWARKNDAAEWVGSAEFKSDWEGVRSELLHTGMAAVGGAPQIVWEAPATEPAPTAPAKVIVLPVALRRLRFSEFVEHWTGDHARIATSGPDTATRLRQIEDTPAPIPASSRFVKTRYDGVGAITFASVDALAEEFASAHYRDVVAPDELRFTDTAFSAAFLASPIRLA